MKALRTLQARLEAAGYQVSVHMLAPGTDFREHCPIAARIEAVFSGELRLVMAGEARLLGPGDWIEIPAGITMAASVVGDEPVLALIAERHTAVR
jgi:quercetin dioxygenase-like cupin family protein